MARTNLRHVLHQLRQSLSDSDTSSPLLLATHQTIQLNPDSAFTVDATRIAELVAACQACTHDSLENCSACIERYTEAAALYRGDFLAGFDLQDSDLFEEWMVVQREELHRQVLEIYFLLTTYHEGRGDYEQARHYAWRQIELEPWREEAHRQLMRVLARSGQRTAALAQYAQCRTMLAEELGVEPALETVALYEQIRTDQWGKASSDEGPLGLPGTGNKWQEIGPETSVLHQEDWGETPTVAYFYGRQTELDTLRRWLLEDRCRLVAVLGMGGIGKTSLVINDRRNVAWAYTNLGNASLDLGNHQASARYLRQAVRLALKLHAVPRALAALASSAALSVRTGDYVRAAEPAAHCLHHPASQKDIQTRSAGLLGELAEQLAPQARPKASRKQWNRWPKPYP